MKKLLSAFAVGAALLVLTGCCCDKKCPTSPKCTAQNCGSGECTDEKKDNCQSSQTTAAADTENDNHDHKGNNQPQSQKLSAR